MRKLTGLLVVLFLTSLAPVIPAVAAGGTGPFDDVSGDYVNTDAIQYLKDMGVVEGYSDGTFKPDSEINRAEFTKIVVGAKVAETDALMPYMDAKDCFSDVHDEWFAVYVCSAKDRGIIDGYADGEFKPADKIKFSEAAKIIANTLNGGVAPEDLADSSGQWYRPYVMNLEAKNDIPLSVDFFDQNVTRAEMAEMIYRLKANVTDKATRTYREIEGDGLVAINSCQALQQRLVEQNQYAVYGDLGLRGGGGIEPDLMLETTGVEEAVPAPPAAADAAKSSEGASYTGGGGSADYSTTNIQVEGVDEADVIKNDGRYIYLIRGNSLRIVDAYPADNLKEIVSFVLGDADESFYPTEMYVDGDKLIVIGSLYRSLPEVDSSTLTKESAITVPYFGSSKTKVYIVDISDRANPTVARAVEYDANYTSSRKVGNTLYMVMNQYVYFPYYYSPKDTLYTTGEADSVVPKMMDTASGTEQIVAPCSSIYIMPKTKSFDYLITSAIPVNDTEKAVSNSVLIGDTGNVYASKNALYVAGTDWGGGFYRPYSDYGTMVYRFVLDDGSIMYKNSGKVPGTVLNQFSMDEYNSYFRIVTTKDEWTPGSAMSTGVYVFNNAMDVVGKVAKIAPGEKMYSARFMGKTAYLVTFKRVDPFFVLDMSDPKAPTIKGKLKIPGYSSYLQPYDENHILGFGYDVDPTKVTDDSDWLPYDAQLGMKLSMYDVSDLENPVEQYKEVIGDRGTYSEVLNNHKALLFDQEKGLMAFPVTVYEIPDTDMCSENTYSTCPSSCRKICVPSSCSTENGISVCTADCDGENSCKAWDTSYGKPVFDGAYVYDVSLDKGFTLRGKVTQYNEDEQADMVANGYTDYNKTIQRAIYIGEYLYTISPSAIKASMLSDLSDKKMIELAGDLWNLYYGGAVPM